MKNYVNILFGILIGLLVAGVLWLTISLPRGEPVVLLPTPTPVRITVYVTGAVMAPGVYTLPPDSRVTDAVQAAGGFLPGADEEGINLAARVFDGIQIEIPSLSGDEHVRSGRLNLNTASAEEFDALPGVGPTTAQNIVDYRLRYGPFGSIDQLLEVPGVGPSTLENIRNLITIGP